jgi:hypothetical protein
MNRLRSLRPLLSAGLLLALAGCASQQTAPAAAADPAEAAMARVAGKALTEQNVSLFFDLLRRSVAAAAEGKPPPELSAEEKARLEASSKEMQREAVEASMRMLDQAEREVRETIRKERIGQ